MESTIILKGSHFWIKHFPTRWWFRVTLFSYFGYHFSDMSTNCQIFATWKVWKVPKHLFATNSVPFYLNLPKRSPSHVVVRELCTKPHQGWTSNDAIQASVDHHLHLEQEKNAEIKKDGKNCYWVSIVVRICSGKAWFGSICTPSVVEGEGLYYIYLYTYNISYIPY